MLQAFTIDDIRWLRPRPCYDPGLYLPENWSGTALDILNVQACPPQDRLWVVFHQGWIGKDILHQFAHYCALSVIHLWEAPPIVTHYLTTSDPAVRETARLAASAAFSSDVTDIVFAAAYAALHTIQGDQQDIDFHTYQASRGAAEAQALKAAETAPYITIDHSIAYKAVCFRQIETLAGLITIKWAPVT